MKVEPWKMGTAPNHREDEVIPAEANQNSPLGRQKRILLGQELWRLLAAAKKEGQPGPKAMSPGRPHPGSRKRLQGAGSSLEARGEGPSDLSGSCDLELLEKPLEPGQRWPEDLHVPGLCHWWCLFLFPPKKGKR
jgi:hypothetical protein